tara:strand:+ start:695 stop:946 length:252 start_codon:yes stop_codon:yes gene_type:complete
MENEQGDNENKKDNIKKKSSELKLLIEKYKKNLKEIQEECRHEPILKLVSESGLSSALRIVCKNCEKVIGYPSQSDNKDFYGN